MNNLKILNIYNNKEFIPEVSNWIFNTFIKNIYKNISYNDIEQALHNRLESRSPMTFIGLIGTKCIGTISIFENDLNTQEELKPWLAALFIHPDYRNNGYGKILINKVVNIAKNQGFTKLYLRTESTGKYYSNIGWVKKYETIDENDSHTTIYEKFL